MCLSVSLYCNTSPSCCTKAHAHSFLLKTKICEYILSFKIYIYEKNLFLFFNLWRFVILNEQSVRIWRYLQKYGGQHITRVTTNCWHCTVCFKLAVELVSPRGQWASAQPGSLAWTWPETKLGITTASETGGGQVGDRGYSTVIYSGSDKDQVNIMTVS